MATQLRVLIVEDNPSDSELMLHTLRHAGYDPVFARVETEQEYRVHLKPDLQIILADFNMPDFDALRALQIVQESLLDIPFIVVSGAIGEEIAVGVMQGGATDYVLKDRLGRLGHAVTRALEQKALRTEARLADRRLLAQHATTKVLAESTSLEVALPRILEEVCKSMDWAWAGAWMVDAPGQSLRLAHFWHSPLAHVDTFLTACRERTFRRGEGLPGRVWAGGKAVWLADVMEDEHFFGKHAATVAGLHAAVVFPVPLGRDVVCIIEFISRHVEPPNVKILGMMTAIGSQIEQFIDKVKTKSALDKEQDFLKAVLDNAQDGIVACDAGGALTFINRAARELLGQFHQPILPEGLVAEFGAYHADGQTILAKEEAPLFRALRGESLKDLEIVIRPHGNAARNVRVTGQPIRDAAGKQLGAVVVMHDVTERNHLEQQLRQAQKMEAFGQLAGGVAHDFNNLLAVILGYSELMLGFLRLDDRSRGMAQEIHNAGERAALLTRQLLAFSRKQVVQLQVLDLNVIVASSEKMLARLIGEDVELTSVLSHRLERVKVDPGQIEQLIMNLAVNARDAMPRGGKITIETRNADLDEKYVQSHPEVKPGRYVLLTVSDTGSGMSDEVKRRIFEPFYTTKEVGKGTGLGLATVFGIVKQSGGHVWVYSEVGQGTSFKVYFPSVAEVLPTSTVETRPAPVAAGDETILIVEDEKAVRMLTRLALQANGYNLLEAGDGAEAIRLCELHRGPIHLLVSDVVMPFLGGRLLAEQLTALHPEMKVLFVSGYTDDAVVRHGVLQADVAFLQKPFSIGALQRKVRSVLDATN